MPVNVLTIVYGKVYDFMRAFCCADDHFFLSRNVLGI